MHDARVDTDRNLLYITLAGSMDATEIRAAARDVLDAAQTLEEGFDIVNDISTFRPFSPEAAAPIAEAQAEIVSMGMDRTVRVITDETSGVVESAFSRRSRKSGYDGEVAASVAEAERLLGY